MRYEKGPSDFSRLDPPRRPGGRPDPECAFALTRGSWPRCWKAWPCCWAAFVGLTRAAFIKQLRHWAMASPVPGRRAAVPAAGSVPDLGLGTRTFSPVALGKLIAYILVPTALLLPDRLRHREAFNWRDGLAMVALARAGVGGMAAGNLDLAAGHLRFSPHFLRPGGGLRLYGAAQSGRRGLSPGLEEEGHLVTVS